MKQLPQVQLKRVKEQIKMKEALIKAPAQLAQKKAALLRQLEETETEIERLDQPAKHEERQQARIQLHSLRAQAKALKRKPRGAGKVDLKPAIPRDSFIQNMLAVVDSSKAAEQILDAAFELDTEEERAYYWRLVSDYFKQPVEPSGCD